MALTRVSARSSRTDAPSHVSGFRCLVRVVLEREFFVDNLLGRIHGIIKMILVDRPCVMGI